MAPETRKTSGSGSRARTGRIRTLGALGGAVLVALVWAGRAPKEASALRVPSDPAEILEHLANGKPAGDPANAEVRELRRILAGDPKNLRAALRLARLDIQLARERSDPRYLGQAQATLAPWWNDESVAPVLVLRATIEQSLHDFGAALRHLDRALVLAPDDPQGWLTRAVILTVQARYDEARASCARVLPLADDVAFGVCEAQIDGLTGRARPAYDRLAATLAKSPRTSPDERAWAVSSLGELAARFGDVPLAERHFRETLAASPDDAYVRGALADLLLDQGRPAEAAEIVRGHEADDGMLLRLAIAERRAKAPSAGEHTAMLGARFDASRARGDVVHRREEARFWLDLGGDPARALTLATANWEVQKEPWDVRVVLAAALAARQPGAASAVLAHLDRTKLEDPAIAKLTAELRR